MTAADGGQQVLLDVVKRFRDEVAEAVLPLDLDDTAEAKVDREALLRQLDDYVLPRLMAAEAPLLAVVGGSTGAGKSTLVNTLVGVEVSRAGVIRPTTTSPVLVHHPADDRWFRDRRILPGLARVTGTDTMEPQPGTVRLVASPALPEGMALLDAPDIDSVVKANRDTAQQLLAAADLWLFVTTAARYADEVPWDLLRTASERGTSVAIVLDRVPAEAVDEIRPHLAAMLRDQGLSTAPIFTVLETALTDDGLLPDAAIESLESWLVALAGDAKAKEIVLRQTLNGALRSLDERTEDLIEASRLQAEATDRLRDSAVTSWGEALQGVDHGMKDGTLLRGEVLARWQEFVGTGEFFKQVESAIAKLRDRITARLRGEGKPAEELDEALQDGVAAMVSAQAVGATSVIVREWRHLPGGPEILAARPGLVEPSSHFADDVARLVRDWQGEVFELVRSEGRDRRTNARIAAYGLNATGVFLMLVAFAHTGGLVGAEVGIAGGTALLAQRVLEAIFGDQAVREMAARARRLLLQRVEELYAGEQRRYEQAVGDVQVRRDQGQRLAAAAAAVRAAR